MEENELRSIVEKVVKNMGNNEKTFPIEKSNKHVHLSQEHVEALFGKGATLTFKRNLSLPGVFVCEERITMVTDKGVFRNIAVLGPTREETQVELCATDAYQLGIKCPVNISGDLSNAGDIYLLGPEGAVFAKGSCIIPRAHIHMSPAEAIAFDVTDGETVCVDIDGERSLTLRDVMVRVKDGMHATVHIDMDEANALGHRDGTMGRLRKIK